MLKATARSLIGKRSWEFLSWHRSHFGLLATLRKAPRLLGGSKAIHIDCDQSLNGIWIRPGTTDQNVYDEVFLREEYRFDAGHPHFIIDAGAHIGLASVFFANRYPQATIISLEPNESNFEMLVRNSTGYPNIHPIKAGLWSHSTALKITNPNAETWSFCVTESPEGGDVEAVSVSALMKQFDMDKIDLFKMDIEGSEIKVLSTNNDWLDHVNALVIELHDRFQPGCSDALDAAFEQRPFSRTCTGESTILTRIKP